jgi:hypothetical protein
MQVVVSRPMSFQRPLAMSARLDLLEAVSPEAEVGAAE